jgi:hypothetical protein
LKAPAGLPQSSGIEFITTKDTKSTKFGDWSLQATFTPEIYCTVVWAKFKALAGVARIAMKQLW